MIVQRTSLCALLGALALSACSFLVPTTSSDDTPDVAERLDADIGRTDTRWTEPDTRCPPQTQAINDVCMPAGDDRTCASLKCDELHRDCEPGPPARCGACEAGYLEEEDWCHDPATRPEDLQASQGTERDHVLVTWSPVPDARGYHVYRDDQRLTTSPITDTMHRDFAAPPAPPPPQVGPIRASMDRSDGVRLTWDPVDLAPRALARYSVRAVFESREGPRAEDVTGYVEPASPRGYAVERHGEDWVLLDDRTEWLDSAFEGARPGLGTPQASTTDASGVRLSIAITHSEGPVQRRYRVRGANSAGFGPPSESAMGSRAPGAAPTWRWEFADAQPDALTMDFRAARPPQLLDGGHQGWSVVADAGASHGRALRSGAIGHNQSSAVLLPVVAGPGSRLQFRIRVSSEACCDRLRVLIDGEEAGRFSGEQAWQEVSYPLEPGLRLIEWRYAKDGSVNRGEDAAFIDDLQVIQDVASLAWRPLSGATTSVWTDTTLQPGARRHYRFAALAEGETYVSENVTGTRPATSCTSATPDVRTCGNCGSQARVCTNGAWSAWSLCWGEGTCRAGSSEPCGTGGTRTCSSACAWNTCQGQTCSGPTSQPCGDCGTQTRTCNNGTWSAWSTCSGQGLCTPGSQRSCSGGGTQTCTTGCSWGTCQTPTCTATAWWNPLSVSFSSGRRHGSSSDTRRIRVEIRSGSASHRLEFRGCMESGTVTSDFGIAFYDTQGRRITESVFPPTSSSCTIWREYPLPSQSHAGFVAPANGHLDVYVRAMLDARHTHNTYCSESWTYDCRPTNESPHCGSCYALTSTQRLQRTCRP